MFVCLGYASCDCTNPANNNPKAAIENFILFFLLSKSIIIDYNNIEKILWYKYSAELMLGNILILKFDYITDI